MNAIGLGFKESGVVGKALWRRQRLGTLALKDQKIWMLLAQSRNNVTRSNDRRGTRRRAQ